MQTYDFSDSRLTACGDTAGQTSCKDQSRWCEWEGWLTADRSQDGVIDMRIYDPQCDRDSM